MAERVRLDLGARCSLALLSGSLWASGLGFLFSVRTPSVDDQSALPTSSSESRNLPLPPYPGAAKAEKEKMFLAVLRGCTSLII